MQYTLGLRTRLGLFNLALGLALTLSCPASYALDVKVGQWKAAWEESKHEFETNTDKKKPSKKILNIRVGSGLEKTATAVDKVYADLIAKSWGAFNDKTGEPLVTDKDFKKDLNNLSSKIKAFRKAAKEYQDELRAADTEDKGEDYTTELQVLAGHLEAIEGQMMGQPDTLNAQREQARVRVEGRLAGKGDQQIKEDQKDAKQVEQFFKPTLGAIKKARGGLAEARKFMKSYSTAQDKDKTAIFDKLNTLARDVSQNMVNLTNAGARKNHPFKQNPDALATEWARWGDNPRLFSTLKTTSSAQDVTDMIGNFEQLLNQTEAWVKNEQ